MGPIFEELSKLRYISLSLIRSIDMPGVALLFAIELNGNFSENAIACKGLAFEVDIMVSPMETKMPNTSGIMLGHIFTRTTAIQLLTIC